MALSAPQQNGDLLSQADVEGHTLIVAPTEFVPHIQTVNTKPGEQSPAIRCNVVDLSTEGGPTQYTGVLWFGVISQSMKRQIGETVLARMGKGTATSGKNAPWTLIDIMSEQAWVDYANQWLEANPEWEIEAINEINRVTAAASVTNQVQAAATPTQSAPPASAPARTVSATPTSGPPAAAAPAGPPSAALLLGPPSGALPPGLEAMIAAMPADQQAAARALMAAQQQAAS